MSGIINQVGAKSGIISGGGSASTGTVTSSGPTGLDIELGEWTGTLTSVSPPSSPPTATMYYKKIGTRIHISGDFGNVNTSGGSGDMRITGLPFTPRADSHEGGFNWYGIAFDTSTHVTLKCGTGGYLNWAVSEDNGAWSTLDITAGTTKYISFSMSYNID